MQRGGGRKADRRPGEIAQQILSEQEPLPAKHATPLQKVVITILLILGSPIWGSLFIGAFCLIAGAAITILTGIFSAYLVIWCLPLITGAFSISSLLLAVISTVGAPFLLSGSAALGVTQFGIGVFSAGTFILFGLLTYYLAAYFIKVTARFTHWLKRKFASLKRRIAK